MKKILSYFLQGLLYTVPIAVTIYVVYIVVAYADALIDKLNFLSFGHIPGMGLVVTFVLISMIGYFGPAIFSTSIAKLAVRLINKAPLIRTVYSSMKDLMNAFVGKERKFGTPVLVALDDAGNVSRLGFITSDDLSRLGIEGKIAVCLPSSYGVLGDLIIVPTRRVTKLDAHAADVMKFIVSGGVTTIEQPEKDEL